MSGLTNVDNWILGITALSLLGTWYFVRYQTKHRETNRGLVYKNMSTLEKNTISREQVTKASQLLSRLSALENSLKTIQPQHRYYVSDGSNTMVVYGYGTGGNFSGMYIKGEHVQRAIQEEIVQITNDLRDLNVSI